MDKELLNNFNETVIRRAYEAATGNDWYLRKNETIEKWAYLNIELLEEIHRTLNSMYVPILLISPLIDKAIEAHIPRRKDG